MIIDRTYFWGELRPAFIAFGSGTSSALETKQREELDGFIAKYEPIFLKKIFGDLYDTYVAGRATEPWLSVDKLIVDSTAKTSVIANYVFFYYWNYKQYGRDDSGTFISERDKGVVVSNGKVTKDTWNEMVKNLIPLFEYLDENHDTLVTGESDFNYDEWADFVYYDGCYKGRLINDFGI